MRRELRWARGDIYLRTRRATAFAVYVGSKGVLNWVEAEVRLVLSRATGSEGRFPFVPVIAAAS